MSDIESLYIKISFTITITSCCCNSVIRKNKPNQTLGNECESESESGSSRTLGLNLSEGETTRRLNELGEDEGRQCDGAEEDAGGGGGAGVESEGGIFGVDGDFEEEGGEGEERESDAMGEERERERVEDLGDEEEDDDSLAGEKRRRHEREIGVLRGNLRKKKRSV